MTKSANLPIQIGHTRNFQKTGGSFNYFDISRLDKVKAVTESLIKLSISSNYKNDLKVAAQFG